MQKSGMQRECLAVAKAALARALTDERLNTD